MTTLLEVRDLQVMRDRRQVLSIDHLAVEPQQALALVGPNGAGKSTLLLVLAGLLKPSEGRIIFCGQPVEPSRDLAYRRRIGLVLQDPLLLDMSVYANVALGLRFRRLNENLVRSRVSAWLERLGIAHLSERPAYKLSGGEAQRVALARAFALQPELLLLDEPFNSVDKKAREELVGDLKTLLPLTGAAVLFSTHDEREVEQLAEARIELVEGKVTDVGSL